MKRNYINTIGLCTAAVIALGAVWFFFRPAPVYPLGGGLEYVGADGYGCYVICDAYPTEIYYYKTDMSFEEILTYFKKARRDESSQPISVVIDGKLREYLSQNMKTDNGNIFTFDYYEDGQKVVEEKQLEVRSPVAPEQHIIRLNDSSYTIAKEAL